MSSTTVQVIGNVKASIVSHPALYQRAIDPILDRDPDDIIIPMTSRDFPFENKTNFPIRQVVYLNQSRPHDAPRLENGGICWSQLSLGQVLDGLVFRKDRYSPSLFVLPL